MSQCHTYCMFCDASPAEYTSCNSCFCSIAAANPISSRLGSLAAILSTAYYLRALFACSQISVCETHNAEHCVHGPTCDEDHSPYHREHHAFAFAQRVNDHPSHPILMMGTKASSMSIIHQNKGIVILLSLLSSSPRSPRGWLGKQHEE